MPIIQPFGQQSLFNKYVDSYYNDANGSVGSSYHTRTLKLTPACRGIILYLWNHHGQRILTSMHLFSVSWFITMRIHDTNHLCEVK